MRTEWLKTRGRIGKASGRIAKPVAIQRAGSDRRHEKRKITVRFSHRAVARQEIARLVFDDQGDCVMTRSPDPEMRSDPSHALRADRESPRLTSNSGVGAHSAGFPSTTHTIDDAASRSTDPRMAFAVRVGANAQVRVLAPAVQVAIRRCTCRSAPTGCNSALASVLRMPFASCRTSMRSALRIVMHRPFSRRRRAARMATTSATTHCSIRNWARRWNSTICAPRCACGGMGLILDFVPNHMGLDASANPWWHDVLQHGKGSSYADYFDIDWEPEEPGAKGRILLPVVTGRLRRRAAPGRVAGRLRGRRLLISNISLAGCR